MTGLLRRATKDTMRELGFNAPTVITAVAGIGLSILAAAIFSALGTQPVTGLLLWLIKTIQWSITVSIVFVPFLTRNIFLVARRERSVRAHLELTGNSATSADNRMKSFLRNALTDASYGVAKCYAFGSVVRQYPTRDVDIIIQFDSSEPHRIRAYRDRLKYIETIFHGFHGRRLHLQMFLSSQDETMDKFLQVAGSHERLI